MAKATATTAHKHITTIQPQYYHNHGTIFIANIIKLKTD
jgi:hypothetical protein